MRASSAWPRQYAAAGLQEFDRAVGAAEGDLAGGRVAGQAGEACQFVLAVGVRESAWGGLGEQLDGQAEGLGCSGEVGVVALGKQTEGGESGGFDPAVDGGGLVGGELPEDGESRGAGLAVVGLFALERQRGTVGEESF